VTVTDVPAEPEVGVNEETTGPEAVTVNDAVLVPVPAGVVTAIGPVLAPAGTVAVTWVSELTVNVADMPLNFTAVAPVKPLPVTVTDVPAEPEVGVNEETTGPEPVPQLVAGKISQAVQAKNPGLVSVQPKVEVPGVPVREEPAPTRNSAFSELSPVSAMVEVPDTAEPVPLMPMAAATKTMLPAVVVVNEWDTADEVDVPCANAAPLEAACEEAAPVRTRTAS
jgi:hypothetical protein